VRILPVSPAPEDPSARTKPAAAGGRLVASDTIVCDAKTGDPLIIYQRTGGRFRQLRNAVQHVMHRQTGTRRNQDFTQVTHSKPFGWQPKTGLYGRQHCYVTGFDQPLVANALQRATVLISDTFRDLLPAQAAEQAGIVEQVPESYRLSGGLFTSGIVNWDCALRYHRDLLNMEGIWSGMVVFREESVGGMLHVPAMDLTLQCDDEALVIFSGRDFWHGVTPIQHRTPRGYRTSVVWYALRGLCSCNPDPLEEIQSGLRKRTTVQENIARRDIAGEMPPQRPPWVSSPKPEPV